MPQPSRLEFIALIASITMLIAFAIDAMLPALPAIGESLGIADETRWSLVITFFTGGFGIAQLFIGTLSDRFGRRKLLLASLVAYAGFSVLAAFAQSFELLLGARMLQGAAAAGGRVIAQSVVRDRFTGRDMAQVMSLSAAVFMAAPILAPSMGTVILWVAPWRWIFIVLGGLGGVAFLWSLLRLPETLPPAHRRAITPRNVIASARIVLADRQSVGYSIGTACLTVAIMGFLTSVQLVFSEVLHRGDFLPLGFAIIAGTMMMASLVNARIVMRFGMRRIGHAALIAFTLLGVVHAIVALTGHETLVTFVFLQAVMMGSFSLTAANFGAMAMEKMGEVAGTASSLQGSFASVVGAVGGAVIGQSFDGTTLPLYVGVVVAGLIALAAVFVAEGGRLFVVRHVPESNLPGTHGKRT